jgi:phosphate transport system protein
VRGIVADAVLALRQEDVQAAGQVIERGQRIDTLVREVLRGCFEALRGDPRTVQVAMRVHEVAGHLQRIAAHATNIAEMVIFLVRGEDVRHAGRLPSGTAPGASE